MFATDIGRLRIASLLDGISYLILLFIAMPLKYLAGLPIAVKIVGSIHGALFVGLCFALLIALRRKKLTFVWSVVTFLCALVPFAPFLLDRKLRTFGRDASIDCATRP